MSTRVPHRLYGSSDIDLHERDRVEISREEGMLSMAMGEDASRAPFFMQLYVDQGRKSGVEFLKVSATAPPQHRHSNCDILETLIAMALGSCI